MNNSSLFPFERNHYFYGKLLSVEDFELEQRYLNDKRRLINRFLFGAGVAVGLNVVDVDEQTVSVEAGFALDSWGREIVVEEPVLLRLDNITGFDSCLKENADVIYLCLEYREQETDIVHSITDATSGDHRHQEYGRIRESFRLFLTSREPEEELRNVISAKNLIECPKVIWENEDIRITHILPRLIQKGHGAFLTVRVENRGRSTVSFSYELMLSGLSHETDQKSVIRVNFDESLYEKTGDYELRFPLVAPEGSKEYGCVNINPDSVKLSLSGSEIPVKLGNEQTVLLTEKNEAEAIQDYYYQLPMEQVAESGYQAPIYLARLFVVSAVDTYMIERVENLPYKQYVSNNRLLANFGDQLAAKVKLGGSIWGQANDAGSAGGGRVQALGQIVIAQGVADLVIQGGRRDDTIFSQEITHGIGLGRVAIILGLQEHKKEIIYGDSDVFEEDSGKIRVKLAAKVNEDDGTFVIGVKLLAG
ncbi:MAG: hypothetical protein IJV04_02990, partial [Lachnospiraceae bacterium]|nr:hypothetical protein [Lachnospiraceae bacterium]